MNPKGNERQFINEGTAKADGQKRQHDEARHPCLNRQTGAKADGYILNDEQPGKQKSSSAVLFI